MRKYTVLEKLIFLVAYVGVFIGVLKLIPSDVIAFMVTSCFGIIVCDKEVEEIYYVTAFIGYMSLFF